MWFTSDNAAGAPREVMEAVAKANEGWTMAYGADDATERARTAIREAFEAPAAAVHFVSVGTAANALALACMTPPWGTVYCHKAAHIEEDECGAPEFYTSGAKLTLIDGAHGLMDPARLERALSMGGTSVHNVQRGAVSITQVTEAGTCYSIEALTELCAIAKAHDTPVHLDGTRFANALVTTGATPAEMSWKAGVDILCLGFTKNGALAAEAVIIFDEKLAWEFELRRKRGGHLFSKMRFMAAQAEAMMEGGLWLRLASHANARAAELAAGIEALPGARLLHPVDANLMFAQIPEAMHKAAQAQGAAYYDMPAPEGMEDDGLVTIRLVCSFQTTAEDVQALLAAFRG